MACSSSTGISLSCYIDDVRWEVEFTSEFEAWWNNLTASQQERVTAAVNLLERFGPTLGRPLVDTMAGSRISNLKELRPPGTSEGVLRILFCFDSRRVAILLLGGDKAGDWNDWYEWAIPEAERVYDEYLAELRREGLL